MRADPATAGVCRVRTAAVHLGAVELFGGAAPAGRKGCGVTVSGNRAVVLCVDGSRVHELLESDDGSGVIELTCKHCSLSILHRTNRPRRTGDVIIIGGLQEK
jgi:hypothetical protein